MRSDTLEPNERENPARREEKIRSIAREVPACHPRRQAGVSERPRHVVRLFLGGTDVRKLPTFGGLVSPSRLHPSGGRPQVAGNRLMGISFSTARRAILLRVFFHDSLSTTSASSMASRSNSWHTSAGWRYGRYLVGKVPVTAFADLGSYFSPCRKDQASRRLEPALVFMEHSSITNLALRCMPLLRTENKQELCLIRRR